MAQTIIPVVGATIAAADTAALNEATSADSSFVISGYSLSDGGGLNVDVAAGSAMVNGYFITDTTDITGNALTDSTTNYVFLLPAGTITVNTTGTNPGSAILLGTVVTAGGSVSSISHQVNVTSGQNIIIRKASDETVTATTTAQADDELLFSVGKRQIWEVEFRLLVVSPSAADMKFELSYPSGTTGELVGVNVTVANNSTWQSISGTYSMATSGANEPTRLYATFWTGDASGTITLKWAQQTSDGGNTIVRAGSTLIARRILG